MQTRRNRRHGGVRSSFKKKAISYKLPVSSKLSMKQSKKAEKLLQTNLETILEKPSYMNEHDSEYADNVIEKFKNFLERVQRVDAKLYLPGRNVDERTRSNMDMLKALIAEKLVDTFGNKERGPAAAAAAAPSNAFNDDLASLLGKIAI